MLKMQEIRVFFVLSYSYVCAVIIPGPALDSAFALAVTKPPGCGLSREMALPCSPFSGLHGSCVSFPTEGDDHTEATLWDWSDPT